MSGTPTASLGDTGVAPQTHQPKNILVTGGAGFMYVFLALVYGGAMFFCDVAELCYWSFRQLFFNLRIARSL